jgi:flavodoxin I
MAEVSLMKALIIYDSLHGNTGKIARAISGAMGEEIQAVRIDEAKPQELGSYDIVIVGSPTQGGRHTKKMQEFLDKIPTDTLKSVGVAVFDTRERGKWVKIFGYAADRIADELKEKGCNLIAPPEPFYVKRTKGPLVEGELEHAAAWGKAIAAGTE